MNNLESLVPPLELCKRTPAGKFADSALVYTLAGELKPRHIIIDGFEHWYDGTPAPTLAEILEALYAEADGCCIHTACYLDSRGWEACVVYECHDDSGYGGDHNEIMDANPATAALRLWLEVEGVKDE